MKKLFVRYYNSDNLGDALNVSLIKMISGVDKIVAYDERKFYFKLRRLFGLLPKENYLVIGSMLKWADKNTIVWGTGFISAESKLSVAPKKICAVRGPLTRKIVLSQGYSCPEVYGDPALLLPKYYSPSVKKKYKLGIVPHYVDKENSWVKKIAKEKDVLVLDITKDYKSFVNELLSCENIASSSLHCLILSDAYRIKNVWIKLSDLIVGDDFKFLDYFQSIKRNTKKSLKVSSKTSLKEILLLCKKHKVNLDLDSLLAKCPFRHLK